MEQEQREYLKTTDVIEVKNYPYGRLRTSAFFGLEFKQGKGFRSTFQTINPKTGKLNAIKKSTYSDILIMYREAETGHIKTTGFFLYDDETTQKLVNFLDQHFDLFTPEQIENICITLLAWFKQSMYSRKIYCNADIDKLLPIFDSTIKTLVEMIKSKGSLNKFAEIKPDWKAARDLEQKDFNPFRTINYGAITDPNFGKTATIERGDGTTDTVVLNASGMPLTSSGHGSGAPANINGDNYNG